MLGVATIGNATLIAIDDKPILATDPWIGDRDEAYFGSWCLSHEIPARELDWISQAKYHWYSHGHPDHLNPNSVKRFQSTKILIADHVGGRIRDGLRKNGFEVEVLPERTWVSLSENVKVQCISDLIQDSILLVDVNGRLFLNMNDAGARGCKRYIRKIVREYKESYLLRLSTFPGFGEADMTNVFNEDGERINLNEIKGTAEHSIGETLSSNAKTFGVNHVIPFSSFHSYQRTDSLWAKPYIVEIDDYCDGFDDRVAELIPAFSIVDCVSGEHFKIDPAELEAPAKEPEEFGDNWSDDLEKEDKQLITEYFKEREVLADFYEFIKFKVGASEHTVELGGPKGHGITFEVPRNSLITSVRYEIFDDLLIGNFMKTTLHNIPSLYEPNFNYIVAKFADNGLAKSRSEIEQYMRTYRARAKFEYFVEDLEFKSVQFFRNYLNKDAATYKFFRGAYRKYLK